MKYTSIAWLNRNEQAAINESFAMMAYNPSIGRVLRPGGVKEFKKIAVKKIPRLKHIRNQKEFDRFHDRFVNEVMGRIKKTSSGSKISYGHGQKAVNVFLKVYVDWASYPDRKTAERIKSFLHVPLDYWLMWYLKNERRKDFDKIIKPVYKKENIETYSLSLAKINKKMYEAWQDLCRKICPLKPVLLDVIWAKAPR